MFTRTKIICTIGPACNTVEKMLELIDAGMNVARLNFSHGTHEEHQIVIDRLKEARKIADKPLAIMLDTKGPEVRVGTVKGNELVLEAEQELLLVKEQVEGTKDGVTVTPALIFEALIPGATVLFDNGYIISHVVSQTDKGVIVRIENPGVLKSFKGVNIPNRVVDLPAVTDKDIEDIHFGCKNDIDLIAASFVRSADHVLAIKRLLAKENKSDILVVAKIENFQGVENYDSIVQVADGIMIARGDLGVELPLSKVPHLQKMMIRKAYLAGKPSVTATQMLESMITNPRPTRAEVSDVANAIYDSTSSVMLSGETAVGRYPVETVRVMRSIVQEAETNFNYRSFFHHDSQRVYHDVPSSVTLASVKTAYSANAKAIFAFTSSGLTVRLLSRLRPEMPIIGLTPHEKKYHQLAFNWGAIPVLCKPHDSFSKGFAEASIWGLEHGCVSYGDLVVATAGSPFGVAGTTNMMIVENIGDVLVRAHSGYGRRVSGPVAMVMSIDPKKNYDIKDRILVVAKADDSYLPLIKQAKGIILQNHVDDFESEKYIMLVSKALDIPAVIRGDGAWAVLKENQIVTLDPHRALVYKGNIPE
ncbi:MAG: pyruvate kinase [Parachlamydiales bacterium]|nr:pyruvate kinase [Parachlamydiales bacterium]